MVDGKSFWRENAFPVMGIETFISLPISSLAFRRENAFPVMGIETMTSGIAPKGLPVTGRENAFPVMGIETCRIRGPNPVLNVGVRMPSPSWGLKPLANTYAQLLC